jgi:hypothetical protein
VGAPALERTANPELQAGEDPDVRHAAAIIAVLLGAASEVRADDLDQRVQVRGPGLLQVDLDFGEGLAPEQVSLEVASHDADEVYFAADSSGWGGGDVKYRLDQDEQSVRLYGSLSGWLTMFFGGPTVRVRVWVPREYSVALRTSAGPIRVEDVTGSIRVRARNGLIQVTGSQGAARLRSELGDVRVSEMRGVLNIHAQDGQVALAWVEGEVRVTAARGNVEARHVRGRLEARTDGGEVALLEVSGPALVKSERGSVLANFDDRPSGVLETRNGTVEVSLNDGAGVQLDAHSADGTVELGPGLRFEGERQNGRAVGRVNGGGEPLRVYSGRGNVRLGRR